MVRHSWRVAIVTFVSQGPGHDTTNRVVAINCFNPDLSWASVAIDVPRGPWNTKARGMSATKKGGFDAIQSLADAHAGGGCDLAARRTCRRHRGYVPIALHRRPVGTLLCYAAGPVGHGRPQLLPWLRHRCIPGAAGVAVRARTENVLHARSHADAKRRTDRLRGMGQGQSWQTGFAAAGWRHGLPIQPISMHVQEVMRRTIR